MPNYSELIRNLDSMIRSGRGGEARLSLKHIEPARVPRPFRVALSELARRAGSGELGIRLLRKLVRPEGREVFEATPQELAEYAACLMRVGAVKESMQLLERLDPERDPKVFLYRSYALISQWNYADSLAPLQAYLAQASLAPYERAVARCNLLAGLVVERRTEEARALVSELKEQTSSGGYHLLYGRVAESAAQLEIQARDFSRAQQELEEAAVALKGFGALDELFVRKWQAVLGLCRNPHDAGTRRAVEDVLKEAAGRGHWETIRSLEIQKASALKDVALATHIYFGTRFEAFRKRIRLDIPFEIPANEPYTWRLGQDGGAILEVSSAQYAGEAFLKPGQVSHRLLTVLAGDFYRPFRLVELYAEVYPGEYFNPSTLSLRVHQAVQRLRAELRARKIPLSLEQVDYQYHLVSPGSIRLRLAVPGSSPSATEGQWQRLVEGLQSQVFSAKTAAQVLSVSHRSANDLIRAWEEEGKIEREGKGRGTRFKRKAA